MSSRRNARKVETATPAVIARLFEQLALAARSGLPLADAMEILLQDAAEAQSNGLIQALAARTRAGSSLSDAMQQVGKMFPAATVAFVRAAERDDRLAPVLEVLSRDYAQAAHFRGATRAALAWPLVSFIFFLLILFAMAFFVVPFFEGIFASFEADLPGPTRLVIGVSWLISKGWFVWVPLLLGVLYVAFFRREWLEAMQAAADRAALRVPIVRTYLARTFAARLASLLAAASDGAPLREGLAHLVATTRSRRLAEPVVRFEERVAQGQALVDAVAAGPDLPGRLRVAVELGARTNQLPAALKQTLVLYEEEAERSLVRLEQGALVTAYVCIGVLVGMLVIAMYLPIFKMGSVI
jgi:type IV pilus assembly protein PilC